MNKDAVWLQSKYGAKGETNEPQSRSCCSCNKHSTEPTRIPAFQSSQPAVLGTHTLVLDVLQINIVKLADMGWW